MARYIKKYTNSGETQNALNNGQLNKPYVVYITSTSGIDYNSKDISIDYSSMPLTFDILSAGTIEWEVYQGEVTIEYRINEGSWNSISSSTSINANAGDKIQFRGDNDSYGAMPNTCYFHNSTATFNVYGNIMSMVDSTDYATAYTLTEDGTFYSFFGYNTGLISAEHLIIPATTLSDWCYQCLFESCSNLIAAPALPATVLTYQCYYNMFYGCSSLETAPDLPAPTLEESCYESMFEDCTSLNYIKCLATDMSASSCISSWTSGVGESGTFVKDANAEWNEWDIPYGWTVVNA